MDVTELCNRIYRFFDFYKVVINGRMDAHMEGQMNGGTDGHTHTIDASKSIDFSIDLALKVKAL